MAFTPHLIDSFDSYSTLTEINQLWPGTNVFIDSAGRAGSNCLRTGTGSTTGGNALSPTLPAVATRIVGCAVKLNTGSTANKTLFTLRNGTTVHVDVRAIAPTTIAPATVTVTRNGVVIGTAATTLTPLVWHHITLKAQLSATAGRIILLINGVEELNFTGVTQNGATTTTNIIQLLGAGSTQYDDFYTGASDDTSSSLSDMPGDVRVVDLKPNGAGDSTDFSPHPSAPNWSKVNEATPDGDSTYVHSITPGAKDLYTIGYGSNIEQVYAVSPYMVARKSHVGPRTARLVTKSGTTEAEGSIAGLTEGYVRYQQLYDTDPDTSSAWTPAALEILQVGPKVES